MLIHDRFVFLHVPKTGGRFVRSALLGELPECRELSGGGARHYGWERIPAEAVGRPVLAFVRNPWDWYVSWYSFAAAQPPALLERLVSIRPWLRDVLVSDPDVGSLKLGDFDTTIRRACTRAAGGEGVYVASLNAAFGSGLGSQLLTVGRFESLIDDLESFLALVGVVLDDDARGRIRAMDSIGAGDRGPYRAYYDDELRDLVATSCAEPIERFGYGF